ncbi:hypothetical protein PENSPDRAFT_737574 [Peniophora sp. CONT]|nr:hypothetical protein PENSPDRAFT_737574 [Peniophora sp. CONT]
MSPNIGTRHICHLPAETLVLVFSHLDYRDIIALQKSCRRFHCSIRDSAELRYTVALAAAGLCREGVYGDLTSAEMLDKLRRHEEAWLAMQCTECIVLKTRPGERLTVPSNPLIWESSSQGKSRLRLFYANSRLCNTAQHEWEIDIDNWSIFSYIFNLEHDLLVVQTSDIPRPRFHFLSLSTGDPHPKVHLQHLVESDHVLFGHLLTRRYLVLPSDSGKQTVVDWQTGQHITHVMCNYYSLGFLNDDHLLVLPPPQQEAGPCILVYRLRPGPVAVVLAFGLPSFTVGHSMEDCTVKCAPYRSYSLPQFPHADYVSNDPSDALITIGISEYNATPSFEVVLHARALLAYLPVVTISHAPVFIQWESWGVTRSHISLAIPPPRIGWRDNCIFGSRRIAIRPRRRPGDDVLVADVWDYNSRRIARARVLQKDVPASNRRWAVRSSDSVNGIWSKDGPLVTRLPHIKTEMPLPEELQNRRPEDISLYMNDNCVIAYTDQVDGAPSVAYTLVF